MRGSLSWVALVAALGLSACQDTVGTPAKPTVGNGGIRPGGARPDAGGVADSMVKAVAVDPAAAAVAVGDTTRLTAAALGPGGRDVIGAVFEWASSAPEVATVSADGLVTGVAAGTAVVTATTVFEGGNSVDSVSASAAVTVEAGPPPDSEPPPPPPPPPPAVLVGAGDIASCDSDGDEATARLLDGIAGTVATLGDNAYYEGTLAQYTDCYHPTWGRHRDRTMPAPGNHEYYTAGAAGYFQYFGAAAGDPSAGYYSYDLGAWHVVVLNSNSSCTTVSCAAGSPQLEWLRADLAAHPAQCTLAYWHHPRFNSGNYGNNDAMQPFWDALYAAGADVVLNGHEHIYERFAPQTPTGLTDWIRGIRQFTVGTGGRSLRSIATRQANSEVADGSSYGVLKLTLNAGSYGWEFVPVAGASLHDDGTAECH